VGQTLQHVHSFQQGTPPPTARFGTLDVSSCSHKRNLLDINDMMNAPSANQGVSRTNDSCWAAPALPKHGNVKASHDPHIWLYPSRESTSLWGDETLDNDTSLLKDNVAPRNSNITEFDDNLDTMFDDNTWPQPDSLAHNALPDEHENATSEWECRPYCYRETTSSTTTYGHTWLVPVWDERDEDARFCSNAKNPKAIRDSFFPARP
jgi:hypothetical protein